MDSLSKIDKFEINWHGACSLFKSFWKNNIVSRCLENITSQVYGVFAETGKSQPKSLEIGTKSMTKLVNICQDIHSRLFADSFGK